MGGVISNILLIINTMVIAVENGLEEISLQLRNKGYTMVSYPQYQGVVDAFIYKDEMPVSPDSYSNSQLSQSIENHMFSRPPGVLIINATNKNVSQVEEILKTRIYSPLF